MTYDLPAMQRYSPALSPTAIFRIPFKDLKRNVLFSKRLCQRETSKSRSHDQYLGIGVHSVVEQFFSDSSQRF